jgi:hypothetical protein
MPYYLYRLANAGPIRHLEEMGECASYPEASAKLKQLRREHDPALGMIRMIFAENRLRAEELLSETRPPEPFIADDY